MTRVQLSVTNLTDAAHPPKGRLKTKELFQGKMVPPRSSSAIERLPSRAVASRRRDLPADRLAEVEATITAIQQTLDVQFRRIAEMQAEIDRLKAKQ
jgi:hypothetical protein